LCSGTETIVYTEFLPRRQPCRRVVADVAEAPLDVQDRKACPREQRSRALQREEPQPARAKETFVEAARLAAERFEQIQQAFLGYHDIQVLAAGFVAGADDVTVPASRNALRASAQGHDKPAVRIANAAGRSLLGWAIGDASIVAEQRSAKRSSHFEQFELWDDIARAAVGREVDGLKTAFESLVSVVAKEVRSGEFRHSEDRLQYLPGQLIVKLAARDGFSLSPPTQAWWKPCV